MKKKLNSQLIPELSYVGGGQRFIVGYVDEEQRLIELVFNEWDVKKGSAVLEEKNARYLFSYLDKFLNGQLSQKATRKISDTLNAHRTEVYKADVIKLFLSKGGIKVAESVLDVAEVRTVRNYLKKFLGE